MNRDKLADMREVYEYSELLESNVDKNPLMQFNKWMQAAIKNELFEPNAMSIATVNAEGQPSCRTVLLKDIIEGNFVFYTNYESKKGQEIAATGKGAILFWWREHERQVRIEGKIEKVSASVSNAYFQKRPSGSRIGAIASPQSQVVQDRSELDDLYKKAEANFVDGETECPIYWGGYQLIPNLFEFWQGRKNRLHDRIQYLKDGDSWKIERLAP